MSVQPEALHFPRALHGIAEADTKDVLFVVRGTCTSSANAYNVVQFSNCAVLVLTVFVRRAKFRC